MSTAMTGGKSRHQRNLGNTRRANASRPRPAAAPLTLSLPRGDGLRYAFLAGKSIAAAVFVFGVLCALIYTSAAPRKTIHPVGEKQKTIARQATTVLVSKIDLPIRDAPRGDAKIISRAVYGSRVEVLGQDGRWVQVHAIGQNVAGWVEKFGLNF